MTCGCNGSKKSPKVDMKTFMGFGPLKFYECGCGCGGAQGFKKFLISILSAVIFFIIAHPETFKFVRRVAGEWVCSPSGCPTLFGLLLHAVVFFLIVWGLMQINIKKSSA